MTLRSCAARTALLGALALAACATPSGTETAPKSVAGFALAPYAIHEECARLERGDRLEYGFESTEPVDFNVHYHEGNTVLMPVTREKTRADAGVFAPQLGQEYCLMWEAGAAGAALDYRLRKRVRTR